MKALTVRQPWAWAIIHGGKSVENRTRNIAGTYRGPVAIHAGKALDVAAFSSPLIRPAGAVSSWRASYPDGEARLSWQTTAGRVGVRLSLGAIIGVVDLVDAHPAQLDCCDSPWAEPQGPDSWVTHLVLANPRPLRTPIPARGRLGLWTLDGEQLAALIGTGVLSGMECA